MSDDIENRVRKVLGEITNRDQSEADIDSGLRLGHGMDNLNIVELMMLAEEEFGIVISDDEADKVATVGDLFDMVKAKVVRGQG